MHGFNFTPNDTFHDHFMIKISRLAAVHPIQVHPILQSYDHSSSSVAIVPAVVSFIAGSNRETSTVSRIVVLNHDSLVRTSQSIEDESFHAFSSAILFVVL